MGSIEEGIRNDRALEASPLQGSILRKMGDDGANVVADDLLDVTTILRPLVCRMYIACTILRLGTETRYAALVYLHRYFHATMTREQPRTGSVLQRPSPWVAAACLFLATKSQEEPRRLRDVINLAHILLDESTSTSGLNEEANGAIICIDKEPPLLDETYWELKKKLVETEQIVLRWLGFDLFVPHPHRTVALMIRHLPSAHQDLIFPEAARRLNDALFSMGGSALRHNTLELATAAIELAQQRVGRDREDRITPEGWWRRYNVSDANHRQAMDDLEAATLGLTVP
jgi:Cyclin, N-terminal domain